MYMYTSNSKTFQRPNLSLPIDRSSDKMNLGDIVGNTRHGNRLIIEMYKGKPCVKKPIREDERRGELMLFELKHAHVVKAFGYKTVMHVHQEKGCALVTNVFLEAANCDLFHLISDCIECSWSLLDIANGLEYLHRQNIGHRDIKPENVLIFSPHDKRARRAKIADFGMAVKVETANGTVPGAGCGTFAYFPPEYFEPGPLHRTHNPFQADLWAFGVLAFCAVCFYAPWKEARFGDPLFESWYRSGKLFREGKMLNSHPSVLACCHRVLRMCPESRTPAEELIPLLRSAPVADGSMLKRPLQNNENENIANTKRASNDHRDKSKPASDSKLRPTSNAKSASPSPPKFQFNPNARVFVPSSVPASFVTTDPRAYWGYQWDATTACF